ncbi:MULTISPECIES: methyl-accepting chemotaxis protein [Pseudomonas]|uniref:Methyl-accepting chemotaxis protein n=1 Tax=Pseudomonas syringae pv. aptata TaxID=83167 RepID=A0A0Q0DBQ5_PSEAP|nr:MULTISPECIES: methyl-accepting chemotaxis protein [Pseudomonas]KPZ04590.1 Methyl-accepting chemotaxis protein [Pseudomonas syringae pv. aptata]MBI6673565.1 methyl-accepting chemotaxis protein [Pseudomonas syringae]MDP5164245.1 methyl-accepting chemotaxis protein [Pseudomonas syringae pv. aptata str. DSM 50252]RMN64262.1 Methyl-accepting chemotaxis protein [Pseudomonas syringae]RMO72950.1 Methyl-accepting chemotaxis protein [Pseudomonas syringae pv. aptata]
MRNLKVSARAALSFMFIALLLVALGGISVWKMGDIRETARDLEDDALASVVVADRINASMLRLRLEVRRMLSQTNPQDMATTTGMIASLSEELKKQVALYAPFVASDKEGQLFKAVSENTDKALVAFDQVTALIRKNAANEALAYLSSNVTPVTRLLDDAVNGLVQMNIDEAANSGKESEASYQSGLTFVIFIIAAATLATIVLAVLFTKSIVAPLRDMLRVNDTIAKGDLRSVITVTGKDEFSDLMRATQVMQNNLRDTIRLIGDSSTQLASAAEEMNAVTEESSRGLLRQNNEIDQAATAVNQMTAAVDEVARNAAAASDAAKASDQSTRTGAARVTSTVDAIEKLSKTVQSTSVDVERLAVQSKDISKVLEVIRTIAEQTNLLALNAAIEAARAGEQGRGFAVVADEVRALAHRTQTSTQEIEKMIGDILTGTAQATKAMSESCDQADGTLTIAHEAGAALTLIAKAINEINEMNLMIATASEQQAQVARSVDGNLMSIRDLSIQSATGANQTAAASSELSVLAADMNKLVARFSL